MALLFYSMFAYQQHVAQPLLLSSIFTSIHIRAYQSVDLMFTTNEVLERHIGPWK